MSQYTFFPNESSTSAADAFRLWESRLESATNNIEEVLDNPLESYLRTMRICAADRMLTLEFYDAWRSDDGLQGDAQRIRNIVAKALQVLERIRGTGLIEDSEDDKRATHLEEMIENTKARIGILDVLAKPESEMGILSKCVVVDRLYEEFGDVARARGD